MNRSKSAIATCLAATLLTAVLACSDTQPLPAMHSLVIRAELFVVRCRLAVESENKAYLEWQEKLLSHSR